MTDQGSDACETDLLADVPVDARPRHIAIIMDGNGRGANRQNRSRAEGHARGAEVLRDMTPWVRERGISQMTCYALSTENYLERPREEVDFLLDLLEQIPDFCSTQYGYYLHLNHKLEYLFVPDILPLQRKQSFCQLQKDLKNIGQLKMYSEQVQHCAALCRKPISCHNLLPPLQIQLNSESEWSYLGVPLFEVLPVM